MELVALAPDLWACLQEDRGLGCSNSGLVARGGGLVVDTFWDLPHTRALIATYARAWRGPVRRVVNTHHNGDHCWGNQLFPEAEVIGHRLCAASFGRESPAAMQALRAARAGADAALAALGAQLAGWDFSGIEPRPPTTLVDDRLDLDLDGLAVELRYVGPAHTAGDVIVHVPAARVVFAGDVVFRRCTPLAWEGRYDAWLEAARRIDLGPYAGWTEPERILFNVERAYRELRGEPWDAPLDALALFRGMHALREARRGG